MAKHLLRICLQQKSINNGIIAVRHVSTVMSNIDNLDFKIL